MISFVQPFTFQEILLIVWGIFFIARNSGEPELKGRDLVKTVQKGAENIARGAASIMSGVSNKRTLEDPSTSETKETVADWDILPTATSNVSQTKMKRVHAKKNAINTCQSWTSYSLIVQLAIWEDKCRQKPSIRNHILALLFLFLVKDEATLRQKEVCDYRERSRHRGVASFLGKLQTPIEGICQQNNKAGDP